MCEVEMITRCIIVIIFLRLLDCSFLYIWPVNTSCGAIAFQLSTSYYGINSLNDYAQLDSSIFLCWDFSAGEACHMKLIHLEFYFKLCSISFYTLYLPIMMSSCLQSNQIMIFLENRVTITGICRDNTLLSYCTGWPKKSTPVWQIIKQWPFALLFKYFWILNVCL